MAKLFEINTCDRDRDRWRNLRILNIRKFDVRYRFSADYISPFRASN